MILGGRVGIDNKRRGRGVRLKTLSVILLDVSPNVK
jgi:hypothetical protein